MKDSVVVFPSLKTCLVLQWPNLPCSQPHSVTQACKMLQGLSYLGLISLLPPRNYLHVTCKSHFLPHGSHRYIVMWHNTNGRLLFSALSICPIFGNKLLSSSRIESSHHISSLHSSYCTNALRYTSACNVWHMRRIHSRMQRVIILNINFCIMQTCHKNRVLPPSSEV